MLAGSLGADSCLGHEHQNPVRIVFRTSEASISLRVRQRCFWLWMTVESLGYQIV